MATRTYIFAGGGTGGHLFPGIAVAQELARREPGSRILFVGSERDLERSILAQHPFEHRSLPVESLRTLVRSPFRFVSRNWRSWRDARRLIRDVYPSAVVGLGGYASAPVVWAASRRRIPVVLLEQNVIPGRTTRWLSHSADTVCTSFSEAAIHLPRRARVQCTGNPLRPQIAAVYDSSAGPETRPKFTILILGGSQGADSLNDAVVEAMKQVRGDLTEWKLVHQAGRRQADQIRDEYQKLSVNAVVQPFFDDMAMYYRDASLVISRAGATTMAEVACVGLPMILLPYPHAADDHQRANAKSFQDRGAAIIVEHGSTAHETGSALASQLRVLLTQQDRRRQMSDAARALARPYAAADVANIVESLCHE